MDKIKELNEQIVTTTQYWIECGNCGKQFDSNKMVYHYETKQEFLEEIKSHFEIARSKKHNCKGLVCTECFENKDEDWELLSKEINQHNKQ